MCTGAELSSAVDELQAKRMVDISRETPDETDARLRRVVRMCQLKVYEGQFTFSEFPLSRFPELADARALAFVRDDEVWSQLIPADRGALQAFAVFRFHFPPGVDNSGFVGWLATHLKRRFGTGVFVVCGHNRGRGGVFDYWGAPAELADEVLGEVRTLVSGQGSDGRDATRND